MPHSTHGIFLLMGSGEMAPSMVEVHKYAMSLMTGPIRAAFIDTPAGFQLNADLLAKKAAAYFERNLNMPLAVASFKDAARASTQDVQQAVMVLHEANYVFAGPGSPTYALRNWRYSPVKDAIFETLAQGGCLAFASAAALTLGRYTLPVYEIYKVGELLRWVEGMDMLGHMGLEAAVVPHWNNNSGGDHDTRFCFMGDRRWKMLEAMLPSSTAVLGIDEHTACLLRLDDNLAEVRGIGRVTLRRKGQEDRIFENGQNFPLDLLRRPAGSAASPSSIIPEVTSAAPTWDSIRIRYEALLRSNAHPPDEILPYLYDLLTLMSAAREREDWQSMRQAEEALREALVSLLAAFDSGAAVDLNTLIEPYIDLIIGLRAELRDARQWDLADRIRDRLSVLGISIHDQPDGTAWERTT